jgi:hypothetical protein
MRKLEDTSRFAPKIGNTATVISVSHTAISFCAACRERVVDRTHTASTQMQFI